MPLRPPAFQLVADHLQRAILDAVQLQSDVHSFASTFPLYGRIGRYKYDAMAFEASTILELVVRLTWHCLSVPATGKNPLFSEAFFDDDILFDIASAASLSFCPGLSEVINASFPPTVAFFKRLPQKILGLWGIYVLILEKGGHETLVYLGSATDSDDSLVSRFRTYDRANPKDKTLPSKVKEALEKGYKIVAKGVLISAPIPAAKDVPRYRLLFYAIEATFSFLFWTMYSKDKDYQIGSCCLWPRESFTYGGLCSHSALNDLVKADLKLSAEQLEMLAAQNEANKRLQANRRSRESKSRMKALDPAGVKQKNHSAYEKQKAKDPQYFNKNKKKNRDIAKAEDPQKLKAKDSEKYKKLKKDPVRHAKARSKRKANWRLKKAVTTASKEFYCGICDLACPDASRLTRHNATSTHQERAQAQEAGVNPFRCDLCDFTSTDTRSWAAHKGSKPHKALVAAHG